MYAILQSDNPKAPFLPKQVGMLMKLLVNHYIYLGLCTAGLTVFSYYSLHLSVDWAYICFILISTSLLYNHHELLRLRPYEAFQVIRHKPLLLLGIVASLVLCFISVSYQDVWAIILAGIIVMGYYSVGIFKNWTFRKNWSKPISIGIVYALITITFPALKNGIFLPHIIVLTIERIFFIGALALIFDVGDFEKDKDEFHTTVPTKIGIRASILIAIIGIITAGLVNIYAYQTHWIASINFYSLSITYFLAVLFFFVATPHRSKQSFYLIWIDGMIGLPFFLLLLMHFGQWVSTEIISHI
ncbi:MAG: hypothetical protein LC107_02120 [Chitinophagales bacterium]|nr:hypothetical protein [Chitinophagales bacterium]